MIIGLGLQWTLWTPSAHGEKVPSKRKYDELQLRPINYAYSGLMEFSGKSFSKDDALRTLAVLNDYEYLMDERTCVNGTIPFMDFSNYSLKVQAAIPLEERKDFADTWQVSLEKNSSISISEQLNICDTLFIELF